MATGNDLGSNEKETDEQSWTLLPKYPDIYHEGLKFVFLSNLAFDKEGLQTFGRIKDSYVTDDIDEEPK